jgi:hypothetical protein
MECVKLYKHLSFIAVTTFHLLKSKYSMGFPSSHFREDFELRRFLTDLICLIRLAEVRLTYLSLRGSIVQ